MTDTKVHPALTPAEWHTAKLWHAGKMIGGHVRGMVVRSLPPEHQHAAAAIALYGQPFGFTRADVEQLRDDVAANGYTPEFKAWALSLADRIEALLPPE